MTPHPIPRYLSVRRLITRAAGAALCLALPPGWQAQAQTPTQAPIQAPTQAPTPMQTPPAAAGGPDARELSDGEVRKIDLATGKITLKHGDIRHLDMPPMTMVFQAVPPALLDGLKAGDKVRFRAEQADGPLRITRIERLPR